MPATRLLVIPAIGLLILCGVSTGHADDADRAQRAGGEEFPAWPQPVPTGPGKDAEPERPGYGGKSQADWLAALQDPDPAKRREAAGALGCLEGATKDPVPALIAALRDADAGVRTAAACSLVGVDGTHARQAEPFLIAGLKHENANVRYEAAAGLAETGPAAEGALPHLFAALADPEESVRLQAAVAVAEIAPDRPGKAVPILIKTLGKLPRMGMSDVDWALWKSGRASRETVQALTTALNEKQPGPALVDGDKDPRHLAAWLLGLIGPAARPAVPALREARKDADAGFRILAAWALAGIDPAYAKEVVTVLMAELKNPDEEVRRSALGALGEIGPQAKAALPALFRGLKVEGEHIPRDTDAVVAEAIGLIGAGSKEAVPNLIAMLKSEDGDDSDAWMTAIIALRQIGPAAKEAVPALVRLLEKQDDMVAMLVAETLARIDPASVKPALPFLLSTLDRDPEEVLKVLEAMGPAAKDAVPALTAAFEKWKPSQRYFAARALLRIDPGQAKVLVPALLVALKGPDVEERCFAVKLLGLASAAAKEAVPALLDVLQSPKTLERRKAAPVPDKIEPARALLANQELAQPMLLERILNDLGMVEEIDHIEHCEMVLAANCATNLYQCMQAIDTLGRIGPDAKAAVPALLEARRDPSALVRLSAACALARIEPEHAGGVVADLIAGLSSPDWVVRAGAAHALATVGPGAKAAVPALTKLLEDPVKIVRKHAFSALKEVKR